MMIHSMVGPCKGNKGTLYAAGLLLILATAGGCDKIEPGQVTPASSPALNLPLTATAQRQKVTEWYKAVGTVRPRTETRIGSQVAAQVLDVKVGPGDTVAKDQLLIALDSRQLTSRLDQARQGLKSARAAREQAKQAVVAAEAAFQEAQQAFRRVKTYVQSQAATAQDLEKAQSAFAQAEAGVKQAQQGLAAANAGINQAEEVIHEAQIALSFTAIRAPEAGVVLERLAEVGDLALPGKPLLSLRTSGALRLEAFVREGLVQKVAPGVRLSVEIESLDLLLEATVEEVVPYADPASRTFLVKAGLAGAEGLFPGMFGTLHIPLGQQEIVTIPAAAVRRVGQLELIYVKSGDSWSLRYIKTGRRSDDQVEVLAGLQGQEEIGWEG
ncbi:MAG: efflux RND transporter periplasmic adaptor subunit [Desulfobacterales bacterium]